MALRQMGIARMGNYRPKLHGVNQGGKTGRPKLLHNGTGHGLTGGGGMNAKGTGGGIKIKTEFNPMKRQLRKSKYSANKFNAMKINEREKNRAERSDKKTRTVGGPAMNPHPVGNFMYGQDQWGSINKGGQIDWTSSKPVAGKGPTIGFNEALPWLQRTPGMRTVAQQFLNKRRVAPVSYHDPGYFQNKMGLVQERDNALANNDYQRKGLNLDFTQAGEDLQTDYGHNVSSANADLGAANIAGSGIAAAQLGQLAEALLGAQKTNTAQMLQQTGGLDLERQQATSGFNTQLDISESQARERWAATHQGEKLPVSNNGKIYQQGGTTFRQNEHGIPQTWTQAKKANSKVKKFTAGNGQVLPYKGTK